MSSIEQRHRQTIHLRTQEGKRTNSQFTGDRIHFLQITHLPELAAFWGDFLFCSFWFCFLNTLVCLKYQFPEGKKKLLVIKCYFGARDEASQYHVSFVFCPHLTSNCCYCWAVLMYFAIISDPFHSGPSPPLNVVRHTWKQKYNL